MPFKNARQRKGFFGTRKAQRKTNHSPLSNIIKKVEPNEVEISAGVPSLINIKGKWYLKKRQKI